MDHETVEELKRHFGVVAEGVRSDVRAVAEGVALTNERLDRMDARLGRVEDRGEEHSVLLAAMDARLGRVEERGEEHSVLLAAMDSRLGRVEERVGESSVRLASLDSRLGRVEERLEESSARHDSLDSRFDRLEQRVDKGFLDLQSMIRLSYTEIDRRFRFLETEVQNLRARLEGLEAKTA